MKYKIYPPIGIARLGNSDEFFVGPEYPGSLGVDIALNGAESEVQSLKDVNGKVKRQVARFRIFQFADESSSGQIVDLPEGASIRWSVTLVNKKAAVNRARGPRNPNLPVLAQTKQDRILDGGKQEIIAEKGKQVAPKKFNVVNLSIPPGEYPDYLGELRTDVNGNLLVFGGVGKSVGPKPPTHFYTNDGWFDDVSDGPVKAEIVFQDGTSVEVEPAWVIVAPPDFAPTITGIVTLYDVLRQVSYDYFGQQIPNKPSFTQDIYPLLKRTSDLQWVNDDPHWPRISTAYGVLANPSTADSVRRTNLTLIEQVEGILGQFYLRKFQREFLKLWAAGVFEADWHGVPASSPAITPEGLTRAALEACVGQGFLPGIEAGILMENKDIYSRPFDFRLNHNIVTAGDITAHMAQPWQADFLECESGWWPAQRPDITRRHAGDTAPRLWARPWSRPPDRQYNYQAMVDHAFELGVVMPKYDTQGQITGFFEDGRSLPEEPSEPFAAAAPFAATRQRPKSLRRTRVR